MLENIGSLVFDQSQRHAHLELTMLSLKTGDKKRTIMSNTCSKTFPRDPEV